jgi:fused signal recognition particle receptor
MSLKEDEIIIPNNENKEEEQVQEVQEVQEQIQEVQEQIQEQIQEQVQEQVQEVQEVQEQIQEQIQEVQEQVQEQIQEVQEQILEGPQNKVQEINNMFKYITNEEAESVFKKIIVGVEVEVDILENGKNELTELFLDIIKKYDEKNTDADNYFNKMNIQINKEIIEFIQKMIIKTPTLLNEIEKLLIEVIKDNKIDSNDIPTFILIIQILYERVFNQKNFQMDQLKRSEFCLKTLQMFIYIFIEERKIVIDNDKKNDFLLQMNKLSESCINLLHFSNVLEQTKMCCSIM